MKHSLSYLLILFGAVIGSFSASHSNLSAISAIPLALIGGFGLGFCYMLFTSIYSGTVWGIRIRSSAFGKAKKLIGAIGLVIGGFCVLRCGLSAYIALFAGRFVECFILLVAFLCPLIIAPFLAKIFLEKTLAKETGASVLDQVELFKAVDSDLAQAKYFVVGFEGVALFSSTNYCYAVYLYENYQLGELSSPKEVALVGTYFVQKYHDQYKYKVDMEVIPGTPGQTVVAVGTGGIGIARIKGTPDKRIFRSYIFTRKTK